MQRVLKKVLQKITPSQKEVKETTEMFSKIQQFIRVEFGLPAELMGSIAKSTFIAGDKDMDIFVLFSPSTPRKMLEKKGLEIGKAVFKKFNRGKFQISYAEHPYTKGLIGKFHVEVVPAYLVSDAGKIQSAVDRTPFHTAFVKKSLKKNHDVLLLKKFLKGIECYGSDLKKKGFSGYLCELLIIKYGSFEKTLKASQCFRHQEIVDLENHHSKKDAQKIKKMFSGQPLIFIDPVDKNRNVAAVLSPEKLARFIFHARSFLEKPKESYFFPRQKKADKKQAMEFYKKTNTRIVALTFEKPDLIEDILYPQLRRLAGTLAMHAKHAGFKVFDSWVFADAECGIALEVRDEIIPKQFVIEGPSVFNSPKHQERFVKTHSMVWFRNEKYYALSARAETDICKLLSKILRGTKRSMHDMGIPGNFIMPIRKNFKIVHGKDIAKIKGAEFWSGAEKERVK
ncbi:MAG: CCA tRNA nucleotidyltransferase [Candidatus Aenigmarchaeota archaeon]|nr:CCA tRNA nucleotidyltransferase [Candidatus Aenigmarchaeota archaeon]